MSRMQLAIIAPTLAFASLIALGFLNNAATLFNWQDVESSEINSADNSSKEWPPLLSELPSQAIRHNVEMQTNVLRLVDEVAEYFIAKMKAIIECQYKGLCPVRTIIFDISDPNRAYGGMADRLRGLAGTFYAALASERLLQIKWNTPSRLDDLFEGVAFSMTEYEQFLIGNNSVSLNVSDYFDALSEQDVDVFFDSQRQVIHLNQHGLGYLRKIYSDEKLRQRLWPVISRVQHYKLQFSYELATFIALRVLLQSPKPLLTKLIDKLWKEGQSDEHDNCRIGVHFRMAPGRFFHRDLDYPRVTQAQVNKCFLPKTIELAKNCAKNRKSTPFVYIFSDNLIVKKNFSQILANFSIMSYYSDFQPFHVDEHLKAAKSPEERHNRSIETFVEWLVLGRMNQLIISQSGFSELASTYGSFLASRAPTYRLPHSRGYNESCNFEEDYYLRTADSDSFVPPSAVLVTPTRLSANLMRISGSHENDGRVRPSTKQNTVNLLSHIMNYRRL